MSAAMIVHVFIASFAAFVISISAQTASAPLEKVLKLNRVYSCGGERIIIKECDESGVCRFHRASSIGEAAPTEERSKREELQKLVGTCRVEPVAEPQNAVPERMSVYDAYLVSGNMHYASGSRQLSKNDTDSAKRDFKAAIEDYNKALRLNPNLFEALCGIALAHQKQREYLPASAAWKQALAVKRDSVFALNQLGIAYLYLEKYEDSIASFERAVKLKPDFAVGYYNLGLAFASMGKDGEAEKVRDKLSSIDQTQAQKLGNALSPTAHEP